MRMSWRLSTRVKFKGGTSGVQLSVLGGLGIEYGLNDFMGIYLDPNVRYYFDMNQPKSIRTQQPLNIGFELGLRFNL